MVQQFGEKLIDFEWNSFPFNYDEFKSSVYCERLRYYFKMIHPGMIYDSFIHGISHAERVAFYCAIIAWKRTLEVKDADTLIVSGFLHDIGRVNDSIDHKHGARSAKKLHGVEYEEILSTLSDRELLYEIVTAHSVDNLVDFFEILNLIIILKDADALDRIRLSSRKMNSLLLFTKEAKQMIDFSVEVFSKYTEDRTDSIYYHVTEWNNVESIIKTGLKRPRQKKSIFFAATIEDCLQLAPPSGKFYWYKRWVDKMQVEKPETITFELAVLSVDLNGLTDKLFRHANYKAKDMAERKGSHMTYEYLIDQDIEPERIISVENVVLSMNVPVEFKEQCQKYFQKK